MLTKENLLMGGVSEFHKGEVDLNGMSGIVTFKPISAKRMIEIQSDDKEKSQTEQFEETCDLLEELIVDEDGQPMFGPGEIRDLPASAISALVPVVMSSVTESNNGAEDEAEVRGKDV
jgi:hypothetical protein